MDALHISNSLTRQKEKFDVNPPFVGMYVCGPPFTATCTGNVRTF